MKYIININQGKMIEWGLSWAEAAVFAWLYECPSWAKHMIVQGQTYYFASRNKALKEVPAASPRGNPDTIYRHYKKLQAKGLIKIRKDGKEEYIQITDQGKTWYYSKEETAVNGSRKNFRDSEKFPNNVGKISEPDSEKFPTNKDTSIYQDTSNKAAAAKPPNLGINSPEKKLEFTTAAQIAAEIARRDIPDHPAGRLQIWNIVKESGYLDSAELATYFELNNGQAVNKEEVLKAFIFNSNLFHQVKKMRINKIGGWISRQKSTGQKNFIHGTSNQGRNDAPAPQSGKYGNYTL